MEDLGSMLEEGRIDQEKYDALLLKLLNGEQIDIADENNDDDDHSIHSRSSSPFLEHENEDESEESHSMSKLYKDKEGGAISSVQNPVSRSRPSFHRQSSSDEASKFNPAISSTIQMKKFEYIMIDSLIYPPPSTPCPEPVVIPPPPLLAREDQHHNQRNGMKADLLTEALDKRNQWAKKRRTSNAYFA